MNYVLDSSVAFKWVVREVDSDRALRLRDEYRQQIHHLMAPEFFPLEITHSITRAERQGRLTPAEGARAFASIMTDLPAMHDTISLLHRAYTISSAERVGVYDCVYIALAEREGCEMVTADTKLVTNMGTRFPFIVPLSSFPA